ncbi:DNA invertase Pin-like site-specific DNA recombinase [Oikeobacillus pervagus]|uniref:DNA invertase Pin-like site-specific DNA recombinase n=1 Tax=Oikeobacillus pervagus TaxID=1325931 RepID=A0AAJ1SYD1_9BACI|nr:DNA invertase Pin-like site-specific DNA recombinase [Oikeobacillus pervagus]
MKVIGYIRVSTQGQARDGYSLAYQEDEIKAYCRLKDTLFYACLRTRVSVGLKWMRKR